MMKQKQRVTSKDKVTELELNNPNTSVVSSVDLLKKLTVAAVSTVTYLRDIFPLEAFTQYSIADQHFYFLRTDGEVSGAKTLIQWLKSAFVLVNSHYLQKLQFVIHQGDVTLEMYTFSFEYNHDEIRYNLKGEVNGEEVLHEKSKGLPEEIAKSVRQLIRSILVHTSILEPLPDDCEISVKLQVDEGIPEEIFPECFSRSSEDDGLNFPFKVESLKLGKIRSRFNTFTVTTRTVMNRYGELDEENQKENSANGLESDEDEVQGSQVEAGRVSSLRSSFQLMNKSHSEIENKVGEQDSNATDLTEKLSVVNLKDKTVSCICECSDLLDDTIRCVSCATYQHKSCYKLLDCPQVETHVCINCHNPAEGKSCSVPEILSEVNRKESALYRQALVYCCNSSQVSCKRLMTHLKVPRRVAEKIFQKLDNDGCFEPATNKGYIRNVKLDLKENIASRYFSEPQSSDSAHMEVQNSPTIAPEMGNSSTKRQKDEDKENLSPIRMSPAPKRRKILKTCTSLTNDYSKFLQS